METILHFTKEEYKNSIGSGFVEQDLSEDCFQNSNHYIIPNSDFDREGYIVQSLLNDDEFRTLHKTIEAIIFKDLSAYQTVDKDFTLSQYHNCVLDDQIHKSVSKWGIPSSKLSSLYEVVKERVETILNTRLASKKIVHNGTEDVFVGCRIVRPNKNDYNPFHRDTWIDYWKDTINIWIPLSAFHQDSGLQFVKGSHLFKNDEVYKTKSGYSEGDKKYHVPAAVAFKHTFEIVKPSLTAGQGIVFSPFLVHGNGVNHSINETRVSLEFRFSKDYVNF